MTKKVHAFLTKADIFTKLMNANVPKHLRNLCTQFDADTLQQCVDMASVDENQHTSGDSDIATFIPLRGRGLGTRLPRRGSTEFH